MSQTQVPGTLFIVSAPSGAGKTSLVKALIEHDQSQRLMVSISYTTRPIRPGEQHAVNYFFVNTEQFKSMQQEQAFIESAQVFGHYYGTAKSTLTEALSQGQDVILEIDWQGAQQIRDWYPQAVSLFILPPSVEVLRSRLNARGQDDEQVINKRMALAEAEMSHCTEFDYLVVNDDFDEALLDLQSIVQACRLKTKVRWPQLAPGFGSLPTLIR